MWISDIIGREFQGNNNQECQDMVGTNDIWKSGDDQVILKTECNGKLDKCEDNIMGCWFAGVLHVRRQCL